MTKSTDDPTYIEPPTNVFDETRAESESVVAQPDETEVATSRRESVPPTQQDRVIASIAHMIPLFNLLLPLLLPLAILMLLEILFRRNRFLAQHIEEAMAFQFFYFIVALAVLSVFLGQVHCLVIAPFLALYGIACNVWGARAALRGESYHYPLTWRMITRC